MPFAKFYGWQRNQRCTFVLVQGIVRSNINPALSVQIFWSSASALFELVDTKSGYLTQAFGMPEYELLEYGFRQLANSIWRKK